MISTIKESNKMISVSVIIGTAPFPRAKSFALYWDKGLTAYRYGSLQKYNIVFSPVCQIEQAGILTKYRRLLYNKSKEGFR